MRTQDCGPRLWRPCTDRSLLTTPALLPTLVSKCPPEAQPLFALLSRGGRKLGTDQSPCVIGPPGRHRCRSMTRCLATLAWPMILPGSWAGQWCGPGTGCPSRIPPTVGTGRLPAMGTQTCGGGRGSGRADIVSRSSRFPQGSCLPCRPPACPCPCPRLLHWVPAGLSEPQPQSWASPHRCPSTPCGTMAARTCWGPCSWLPST